MQLGMIGLGRMGGNMVRRLRNGGIDVNGFDQNVKAAEALAAENGMIAAKSLDELIAQLPAPRVVWIMLPAGAITDQTITAIKGKLAKGDILVDGGNAHFKDSLRHAAELAELGIEFVDAGVSGGVWGLKEGYALMVGGSDAALARIEPVLKTLAPAPDRGWMHTGPAGSGHYVKMVHNGIEYGLMQAYGEGFALLESKSEFNLDLAAIAEMWRHGSVVRSWLLDLTAEFLAEDQKLDGIAPYIADSGEGRWTAIEAIEQGVPAPIMSTALMMRFVSQGSLDYSAKILAMMRNSFGGHPLKKTGDS